MATDTEPPLSAQLPPWRQELLLLRRRRDGRHVPTSRPPPPPPPPPPRSRTPAPAAADGCTDSPGRQSTSRYIDAFGEIVGLPSPRGACAEPAAAPPDAASEELQYGPGIVSRLRSRYQSMARREEAAPGADTLRRAASLQDLLRREGAFERGLLQDSYLLTGGGAPTAPAAWAESIRKAKSVGDLVSPPSPAGGSAKPVGSDRGQRRRVPAGRAGFEPRSAGGSTASGSRASGAAETARPRGAGEKRTPVATGERPPELRSTCPGERGKGTDTADSKIVGLDRERLQGTKSRTFEKARTTGKGLQKETGINGSENKFVVDLNRTFNKGAKSSNENKLLLETLEPATTVVLGPKPSENNRVFRGEQSVTAASRLSPISGSSEEIENPLGAPGAGPVCRSVAMKADAGGPLVVPQPLQPGLSERRNSLPTADTVSTVKRLFEPAAGAGGGGGGGGGAPAEKGGAGGGGWPAGADAARPGAGDDVTTAAAQLMTALDTNGAVCSPRAPTSDGPAGPESGDSALSHAQNGHPLPNGRSAAPPPLKTKNMMGVLLGGGRAGEKTVAAPMTKASLAAAVKRNSLPLTAAAADPGRTGSVQAVNARLVSAAAEAGSAGEVVRNGASQPPPLVPLAWHQRANNSTLYDFTDRSEVPDYVEDDGMDIHRPAKPKVRRAPPPPSPSRVSGRHSYSFRPNWPVCV